MHAKLVTIHKTSAVQVLEETEERLVIHRCYRRFTDQAQLNPMALARRRTGQEMKEHAIEGVRIEPPVPDPGRKKIIFARTYPHLFVAYFEQIHETFKRAWRSAAATLGAPGVISLSVVGAATAASASSAVTLQMWARADDAGFLPKLVKSFNSTHPTLQIQLTLVPDAQVVQKYSLAASTGSGPDIVSTKIGTMATFTPTNWYQNIKSVVNSLPYRKSLSPAHLGQATYQGEIKGIPFTADVSVLYWNKTLFSKAGLNPKNPPANWAQIASDATKVRTLGGNTYGYFFSSACAGCTAFTMLLRVGAGRQHP